MARCMTKKDNSAFKARYRNKQLAVGKLDQLLAVYPGVKAGTTSISELRKNGKTWILLAALMYDQPMTLTAIDPTDEEEGAGNSSGRR